MALWVDATEYEGLVGAVDRPVGAMGGHYGVWEVLVDIMGRHGAWVDWQGFQGDEGCCRLVGAMQCRQAGDCYGV